MIRTFVTRGYEFEIKKGGYNHTTKEFEIIPFTNQTGQKFPDDVAEAFQIGVGDEYVLLDIVMPEADGLEALRNIRAYKQDAKVVMLSSVGTSTKLIQALKCGAMDFIQKPYTTEQISKIITGVRERKLA